MPVSNNDTDTIQSEKRLALDRLSGADGRFSMLAVDQRQSLRRMVARATGGEPEEVAADRLSLIKKMVVASTSDLGTAVLLDPEYGYPDAVQAASDDVGVLMSAEVSGYEATEQGARRSCLLSEWDPERMKECGASGVKLLIWHHTEAPEAVQRHQEKIVETVGRQCEAAQLPFLLEVKTYPLGGGRNGTLEDRQAEQYAQAKPDLVIHGAEMYSAPRFKVDLLKLEFPVDIKHAAPYQHKTFGQGPVLFTMQEVHDACKRLNRAAGVPWVLLSAGVSLDEFLEVVQLAGESGASGFLCGRTIWKGVMDAYPDEDAMRTHLDSEGRSHFEAILHANRNARPWPDHPYFRPATST